MDSIHDNLDDIPLGTIAATPTAIFQRVTVSTLGRYMLENREDYPCHIIEMSPGDAVVIAPETGNIGEKVVLYVDLIGRIEGTITKLVDGGFEVELFSTPRKRDKMAAQLTWLANKDILDTPDGRRHSRIVPDIRHSSILLQDGRRYNCKVIDISLSGAAIELDVRPALGTQVTLGRMRAKVSRHFQNGIALEFNATQEVLAVVQQNIQNT